MQGVTESVDPLLLPLAGAASATYSRLVAPTWENPLRSCHCYQSVVNGINCFAFEGTANIQEWIIDFMAFQVPLHMHPRLGLMHAGILWNVEPVIDDIEQKLHELGCPPFYLTGHSKGGGEAILAHALLADRGLMPLATRVFEPPIVAGPTMANLLKDDDLAWTQTTNCDGPDIVTLVPGGPTWAHSGKMISVRVPDNYDVATKHVMSGVMAGLNQMAAITVPPSRIP